MTYTVTLTFGKYAGIQPQTMTETGQSREQVRRHLEMAMEHNDGFPGDPATVTITPER